MSDFNYPKNLDKLIDLLRKKGVKSFKMPGSVDLELFDEAPVSNYKKKQLESSPEKPEVQLTDEDWLLWSTDVSSEEVAHG